VIKSTSGSRGFDFELYAGNGSSSGNRYFISITTTGIYWYDGGFSLLAEGLDNSGEMHTYRICVLPSAIAYIFRDGQLLAARQADHSVDTLLGASGPYFQWGDGASGSEADAELEYVSFDLEAGYLYSSQIDVVDYMDLAQFAGDWLMTSSDTGTVPDSNGLVLHYSFDDGSGLAVDDSSGGGHHGRLTNPAAWDTGGVDGGCLRFAGGTRVNVPSDAFESISTAVSICMWVDGDPGVQPDQNWGMIFNGQSPASWRTMASHCPDKHGDVFLDLGGSDTDDRLVWEGSYPSDWEGQWNHYAFVKDAAAGTMAIYLNGELVSDRTGAHLPMDGVSFFTIGFGSNPGSGNSYPYYGRLDDFRLYDRALPVEDVLDIAGQFKPIRMPWDLFADGVVDFRDYAVLAGNWMEQGLL
jgi:hypothetical protein